MTNAKTLLFAFVALSLSLIAVAQAAQPTISHNAAVRRHAAMVHARPARRSATVGDGKMVYQKRQTAEQLAQAAALKKWDDDFHAKNAEWQKAANAALADGKTPPTYDQYWDGKSGDSSSSSSSSGSGSSSDSSDSGSSDQSSAAPAKQEQQQATQPSESKGDSSSSSSQDNSDADSSDECADQDSNDNSSTSSTSSSAPQATSASKAPAAAATGSKNNSAQSNSSSGSSSSSQSTSGNFDGQATYYAPGLGACGWTNTDSDYIVAISASLFDSFGTGNPNKNPACGHKIAVTYGGKSITVSVADRCVGCAWGDLDFTPTAFSQLAEMSKGRLDGMKWSWIGSAP